MSLIDALVMFFCLENLSLKQRLLVAAIVAACATGASAQDDGGNISLELNRISTSSDGGCQVVFFGKNGLDSDLDEVTWRLAVLDAEGVFKNLLALPLGSLSAGKRRIVQYSLPSPCNELSEIIVNDVAACEIGGVESDLCLSRLSVSSRTTINFGL